MSGFCHFGLVYSWFCDRALTLPSCLVFLVSALLRVCSSCAVSCLRARIHVGVWFSDPSTLVLFQAQFWFRVGSSDTHAPGLVLLWELAVSSSLGPVRSSVRVHSLSSFCFLLFCLVLCGTQLVFFTGCVLSCLSCFVCTRGL